MIDSPGLVGVIAQENARFSMFAASLTSTKLPEGSAVKWMWGQSIANNTNALVREMFAGEYDWLWILGDDHAWKPDLLLQLLAHDADIVVPLCLMRTPPYQPVIFSGFSDEEKFIRQRVNLDHYPFGGLIPIHSCGSAGMLIKRQVFEQILDPWFESGVINNVTLGEDYYFCDKAREAGFSLRCDLDLQFGHCLNAIVWPARDNGNNWTYGFSMTGGYAITMPKLT